MSGTGGGGGGGGDPGLAGAMLAAIAAMRAGGVGGGAASSGPGAGGSGLPFPPPDMLPPLPGGPPGGSEHAAPFAAAFAEAFAASRPAPAPSTAAPPPPTERPVPEAARRLVAAMEAIAAAGRRMDARGWVPATAGNLSVRLGPDRVAITASGFHKGHLADAPGAGVLTVRLDGTPDVTDGPLRPSAEALLHCGIYARFPDAGAVVHGHSPANTVLSRRALAAGQGAAAAVALEGYELLKAFPGLATHEARVAVPVFANTQDMAALRAEVDARWGGMADIPPGYLIAGHGAYVWGPDMDAALARLEGLEFMLACEMAA